MCKISFNPFGGTGLKFSCKISPKHTHKARKKLKHVYIICHLAVLPVFRRHNVAIAARRPDRTADRTSVYAYEFMAPRGGIFMNYVV